MKKITLVKFENLRDILKVTTPVGKAIYNANKKNKWVFDPDSSKRAKKYLDKRGDVEELWTKKIENFLGEKESNNKLDIELKKIHFEVYSREDQYEFARSMRYV